MVVHLTAVVKLKSRIDGGGQMAEGSTEVLAAIDVLHRRCR